VGGGGFSGGNVERGKGLREGNFVVWTVGAEGSPHVWGWVEGVVGHKKKMKEEKLYSVKGVGGRSRGFGGNHRPVISLLCIGITMGGGKAICERREKIMMVGGPT